MDKNAVDAGQTAYPKRMLAAYDLWILGLSNHCLWKCPTRLISQQFCQRVSGNHLDVGVGTGYYLKKHLPRSSQRIALVDLNKNSLASASQAIQHLEPEVYCRSILEPLELGSNNFDSVSINYLLHCLPGNLLEKSIIFTHLKNVMNDGGVLFGSTILGGTPKSALASKLMGFYNRKGIFSNENDDLHSLRVVLDKHFSDVKIKLVGCVALFSGVKTQ